MYLEASKFSLWVDFIERHFIASTMRELIAKGIINGATSNPAIFKNAFTTSPAYTQIIETYRGKISPKAIYEMLATEDIKAAAQELLGCYERGDDGYVSIEVDPTLANDAKATIEEGKRLFATIGQPNVMIKIPATEAGYVAMETLVAQGINVNATLIFSLSEALSCARAFAKGQEQTTAKVDTVISVFVSRLDRAIDAKLPHELQAQAGITNAAYIYNAIEKMQVKNNRILFASTGVKGNTLITSYYVDNLLAPNSVNTAPLETIEAFVANGQTEMALPLSKEEITDFFATLLEYDIALDKELVKLKQEGLVAFEEAFAAILTALE
ncbi:MAG: transaldolase [Sulfuricurvum sp. PC08-66]|nr:MAG: transaldolase [Sulfuricurvum sp. PC08-66]